MLVFAGLGNPGPAYARNRHNIGFMVADVLHATWNFSPWKAQFQGQVADGRLGHARVLLVKPMTFMNESGRSLGEALRFYKLPPAELTVFHDELDLDPFRVKVKRGGGAAGQNGIRSVIAHVGEEFRRVRIGIGHPAAKDRVLDHVLGNFPLADEEQLANLLGDLAALAPMLADGDESGFMNALTLRSREN